MFTHYKDTKGRAANIQPLDAHIVLFHNVGRAIVRSALALWELKSRHKVAKTVVSAEVFEEAALQGKDRVLYEAEHQYREALVAGRFVDAEALPEPKHKNPDSEKSKPAAPAEPQPPTSYRLDGLGTDGLGTDGLGTALTPDAVLHRLGLVGDYKDTLIQVRAGAKLQAIPSAGSQPTPKPTPQPKLRSKAKAEAEAAKQQNADADADVMSTLMSSASATIIELNIPRVTIAISTSDGTQSSRYLVDADDLLPMYETPQV